MSKIPPPESAINPDEVLSPTGEKITADPVIRKDAKAKGKSKAKPKAENDPKPKSKSRWARFGSIAGVVIVTAIAGTIGFFVGRNGNKG